MKSFDQDPQKISVIAELDERTETLTFEHSWDDLRHIMDFKEDCARKSLIKLGWIPPDRHLRGWRLFLLVPRRIKELKRLLRWAYENGPTTHKLDTCTIPEVLAIRKAIQ